MSESGQSGGEMAAAITRAVSLVLPGGMDFVCRLIGSHDDEFLLETERLTLSRRPIARQRESGAARYAARLLLEQKGLGGIAIPTGLQGAPQWPVNIRGSLAHDDVYAVASVAWARDFEMVGVDVEPASPLPAEVAMLAVTQDDRPGDPRADGLADRLLFCAKEAVYKAVYPSDRIVLNYDDIVVDLKQATAATVTGWDLQLVVCVRPRIVVIAFRRA